MKKCWSILIAGALVASAFTITPAGAAPTVPSEPNIVDPAGDANYVHDGHSSALPIGRNHSTPVGNINGTGDILGMWFSHDKDNVKVHVHTALSPPSGWGLNYTVYAAPGEGPQGSSSLGCLRFTTLMPGSNSGGGTYQGEPLVILHDRCNAGGSFFDGVPGEFVVDTLDDGSGITTTTWPRSASPLLGDGSVLSAPYGIAAPYTTGGDAVGFVSVPIDNTDVGLDYVLTADTGSSEDPPAVEPPGKNDPPGQGNQNCAKIKNKKEKKACKKNSGKGPKGPKSPPANACAAYTPGEIGAEAETAVVTDEATEDAPLEIDIPIGRALGKLGPYDQSVSVKYNVQLDTKSAENGLFIKLESPQTDDPDLYVYWDNGKEAAVAGGFNQALFAGPVPAAINGVINLNGTGKGGHSGFGYEQIDGLRTADCAGWDLNLVNWGGQGGTYKLKLWVGEIQNDPAPRE